MATPDRPNEPPTTLGQRICTSICLFILLIVVFGLIGWLIYTGNIRPSSIHFEVESATVSQLITEGSSLSATWDITLLVGNPNRKYKMYFDHVQAGVRYHYVGDIVIELGSTPTLPIHFALKRMNQTHVPLGLKIGVERLWIGDAVAQQISNDRSRGSVTFAVTVDAVVRFKAVLAPVDEYRLRFTCDQVAFAFSGNNGTGVMTSQPSCSVSNTESNTESESWGFIF